ncbi:MAG: hypothetical protein JKY37_30605 [Nannocystaceae bacterium]|nr:hypothetical protein [Nannocystaceae bacterium]
MTRPVMLSIWIAAAVGGVGCDSIPAPGGLPGWNTGEVREIGGCEVRLLRAGYYHAMSWNLEVDVETHNRGAEQQRCGWSAQLISGANKPVTTVVGGARALGPGEGFVEELIAVEKDMTGFSGRPAEGDWVLMAVIQGQPIIGSTEQYHATPTTMRPPG